MSIVKERRTFPWTGRFRTYILLIKKHHTAYSVYAHLAAAMPKAVNTVSKRDPGVALVLKAMSIAAAQAQMGASVIGKFITLNIYQTYSPFILIYNIIMQ